MQLYLFVSGSALGIFALTADKTGSNLPAEIDPWILDGNGALPATARPESSDLVTEAVKKHGYFLGHSEP